MMVRIACALLMLASLVACGGMEDAFGIDDPFALPKPFDNTHLTAVPVPVRPQAVAIYPVVGLKPPEAEKLKKAILKRSSESDVLAVEPDATRPMSLRGLLRREKKRSNDLIQVRWFIVDPDGKELASFDVATISTQGSEDGVLTTEAMDALAATTIDGLQTHLVGPDSTIDPVASTPPAETPAELPVYLAKPKGAPGDGNDALQRALAAILDANPGVAVVPSPEEARVRIDGQIKLERNPAVASEDKIDLTWKVVSADGEPLGTIAQSNTVPRGSLDSKWGDTALFAAQAAAGGIVDLFAQLQMAQK
jgi:hypothetical protein